MHGSLLEVHDNGMLLGAIDMSRPNTDIFGDKANVIIANHIAITRHGKKPLYDALAAALQGRPTSTMSLGLHSAVDAANDGSSWCDFGAGCACNQATLATLAAASVTLGSAYSGNLLGAAGGYVATLLAYKKEMDACQHPLN